MASAAQQIASGLSLASFGQASDLKKRLWYTLGALIVFRLLTFIPMPGVDSTAFLDVFNKQQGGVLDLFNSFSGGALARMSIIPFTLMPYITSSIILQLSTSLFPSMEALKKEGQAGTKKINQYARYMTVVLTIVYGFTVATTLAASRTSSGAPVVQDAGFLFYLSCMTAMTGGTLFLMWLGEQITARGIGNGTSLIIMSGIVSGLPEGIGGLFSSAKSDSTGGLVIIIVSMLTVGLIAFICFMERAQRRVLVQYPKRATQYGGMQQESSFLPLKINTASVIPPIFASSLIALPLMGIQALGSRYTGDNALGNSVLTLARWLGVGQPLHALLYGLLITFFCFFYAAVMFNAEETADNLKKANGFIPGIRPGKNTADYLDYVLTRITVLGAAYLVFICLVPEFLSSNLGDSLRRLGGTSLLIVVNVTIDTVTQIQSHLIAHQYGDLLKKAKLKARR
jgi:preprotein translocase subunit SecY